MFKINHGHLFYILYQLTLGSIYTSQWVYKKNTFDKPNMPVS